VTSDGTEAPIRQTVSCAGADEEDDVEPPADELPELLHAGFSHRVRRLQHPVREGVDRRDQYKVPLAFDDLRQRSTHRVHHAV